MRKLLAVFLALLVAAPVNAQIITRSRIPTVCPVASNATVACTLFTSTASASNVSTGETDLITYPMPASTLVNNGQKVRITAVFNTVSNANTKNARVYFGTQSLVEQGFTTQGPVRIVAEVSRTGAATQLATASWLATNLHLLGITNPNQTLSNAITIKVTGQSSAASADVTAVFLLVELVP
jgi:hypothetical protein